MRSLFVILGLATSAMAYADARFQVDPTRIDLSKETRAQAFQVTNHGTTPLRVQISANTWRDDADGGMILAATNDIVIRPSLLQIEPGASKTVRVATIIDTPASEATYRVFVEELPDRGNSKAGQIRVLARIGVPVFVAPANPKVSVVPRVTAQHEVEVEGVGTQHVKLERVVLRAMVSNKQRWQREITGWYVLPKHRRVFKLPLDGATCARGESLVAEVFAEDGEHWTSAPLPCGG